MKLALSWVAFVVAMVLAAAVSFTSLLAGTTSVAELKTAIPPFLLGGFLVASISTILHSLFK